MFPRRIFCFVTFFDACGFYTHSPLFSKQHTFIYLVILVHFSIVLFLTLFFCRLIVNFYPLLGKAEASSEVIQYLVGLVTYWLILFDSILHRKSHRQFWESLQHLFSYHYQPKCFLRCYIVKIVEYFCITIGIVVIRLVINSFVDTTIDFAYAVLFKICQLRIFYYLFCLEVVHFQLKTIERELKEISGLIITANIRPRVSKFYLRRLQMIRKRFCCVYELVNHLNKTFGWSHVAAILYCFNLFLTDLNWFYIHHVDLSSTYCAGRTFYGVFYRINCRFSFSLFFSEFWSAMVIGFVHWQLIIFYLFHGASKCYSMVF